MNSLYIEVKFVPIDLDIILKLAVNPFIIKHFDHNFSSLFSNSLKAAKSLRDPDLFLSVI